MSDSANPALAHHFETLEQQRETCTIGMWAFLVQEVMFFGGLFAAYIAYRNVYPSAYLEGSSHLDATLGTINTGVLIGSSLTMALAVRAAQLGQRKGTAGLIAATMGETANEMPSAVELSVTKGIGSSCFHPISPRVVAMGTASLPFS